METAEKTIIEPFRIKSVEPIEMTTKEERERYLKDAHYNLFLLKSEHVLIDFFDGQRYLRYEHSSMGGDYAGRRIIRGSEKLGKVRKK